MRKKILNIIFVLAATLLLGIIIGSCERSKLAISGRICASPCQTIYLAEYISSKERIIIDSVKLSDLGEFSFTVDNPNADPVFFDLLCGTERIPLVCHAGDNISVNSSGIVATNYEVSGSAESELIREFYQNFIRDSRTLNKIAEEYGENSGDSLKRRAIAKEYHELYQEIKREQLHFIIKNKSSLAALFALYQRLQGDDYIFTMSSDLIYTKLVAEEFRKKYQDSRYVKLLDNRISEMQRSIELMQSITVSDYPELNLPNMHGKKISLSSLDDKAILIDFWDVGKIRSNQNNAELKDLYKDYKDDGLEIYQIGVTTSKALWVDLIQKQRLPWICVSDLRGVVSPALTSYNVTQLPSNILIGKDNQIVGRDLYGSKLTQAIKSQLDIKSTHN